MPRKNGARTAQPQERRTCKHCSHTKPIELFKKSGSGRGHICKTCDAKRASERWRADPEASRAKRRARYWRNVDRERARNRERARSARGRKLNRAAVKRYQQKYPARVAAQAQARAAVKRGEIKVAKVCEILGCGCGDGLHLHHPRYDRPRDVVATCRRHHEEIHHIGPLRLKAIAGRKWARAPRHAARAS
jgi:hypothetical protein